MALQSALAGIILPRIIEIGAHHGEDGPFLDSLGMGGPGLHIMCEPDPSNCKQIVHGQNRKILQIAVGAIHSVRDFYPSEGVDATGSGSLLVPTGHLEHFPDTKFTRIINVACFTLDEIFFDYNVGHIDLIYADMQGAEAEMIRGGPHALAKTRFAFMEAEEIELYAGQTLKPDLIKMLDGWTLVEDFGANILMRNERFTV